jgi:hypothetical protein
MRALGGTSFLGGEKFQKFFYRAKTINSHFLESRPESTNAKIKDRAILNKMYEQAEQLKLQASGNSLQRAWLRRR